MLAPVRSADWLGNLDLQGGIPPNFLYSLFTMDATVDQANEKKEETRERSLPPFALSNDRESIDCFLSFFSSSNNEKRIRLLDIWLKLVSFEIRNSVFCRVACLIVEKCGASEYMENICKIEKINLRVSINGYLLVIRIRIYTCLLYLR